MKEKYWISVLCILAFGMILIRPWNRIHVQQLAIDETQMQETTEEYELETEENTQSQPVQQGLVTNEDGSRSYYKDGEKLKCSWKKIDGNKYYFGKNGKAVTGKKKIDGSYYFFSEKGKMKKGWQTINNRKYYFSKKNGKMFTGKHSISHYLCYFSEKGVLERKIDKDKKMVALTYDDGPSVYTPKVLDTLEKYDAVATFFVVGNRVATYDEAVERAFDMGCEIGNHTYEHKTITKISQSEVKRQISKSNTAVKKVTGKNPVVMRPPGGAINNTTRSLVGMPSILWSVDTRDWQTRNAAKTERAVLDHVKDGDIVLMHDLYGSTAEASKIIIPALIDRGYQLVTVSELAECRGGMKKGKSYYKFP